MGQGCQQHGCQTISLEVPPESPKKIFSFEFNKHDERASPSPSCNLASEDLQYCSESPLSLWISGIARAHPPHSFWVTMELVNSPLPKGFEMARGARAGSHVPRPSRAHQRQTAECEHSGHFLKHGWKRK